MPAQAAKPVVFAAFANDAAAGDNYLRALPEEVRRVRAALEAAEQQGLCDYVIRENVTLDDIVAVFQNPKYQGRIAVLHYGGHAESYALLFQGQDSQLTEIDPHGFAALLAEQPSLQLVFLNACTTEPQVDDLLAAKVQAVIATSEQVDDGIATELAGHFYQALANGATIGSAYRQAVAQLRAAHGDDPANFYATGSGPPDAATADASADPGDKPAAAGMAAGAAALEAAGGQEAGKAGPASGGYWPWHLRWRQGAEASVEWSLPLAAGNPLFGLPPLPPGPLPDSPYHRALDYYGRDLAELFFGRGPQIRDLYQRVTSSGAGSVILYYGQSGVGKSSLLDAGLAPRLVNTHTVRYARRDRTLGLLGTLYQALGAADATVPLATAWRAAEAQAGQPMVLILDQVEEVYTRRNPAQPRELEDFAAALRTLAGDVKSRPQGSLLLGFRKERLAEIEAALRTERIDYGKVFLPPLDATGVAEVVLGPASTPRLRAKYGLTVDPDLPDIIAHDLTADPDAPVAPTLHILLIKLWSAATAQAASKPHFGVTLYQQLHREGILLDDFLRQQIATFAAEQPDAVHSGFLLDLLAYHTTDLGTADQHSSREVHDQYPQRADLDAVLLRSKELYLLADPAGDRSDAAASSGTRLAHDTLAPIVRRAYGQSNLPAQQARRLLESRAVDWQGGQTGPVLDATGLAVVAKGRAGMRALTPDETRLVAASQQEQAARVAQARRRRLGTLAAAAVIAGLLVAAGVLAYLSQVSGANAAAAQAQAQAAQANEQLAVAQAEAADAKALAAAAQAEAASELQRNSQLRTQQSLALANANEAQRLAQLAQQQLATDPVLSTHLALAALAVTPAGQRDPAAELALRQAVLTSRERKMVETGPTAPGQLAWSGQRLAVLGPTAALLDRALQPVPFDFPPELQDVQGAKWSADGQRLLAWDMTTAWVLDDSTPRPFAAIDPGALEDGSDQVKCAEWQPSEAWVAVCTYNALLAWDPDTGEVITVTTALDLPDLRSDPRRAAWSPDGRYLAGGGTRLAVWDSTTPLTPTVAFDVGDDTTQFLASLAWLPDGEGLVWSTVDAAGRSAAGRWNVGEAEAQVLALADAVVEHPGLRLQVLPGTAPQPSQLLARADDGYLALLGLDGTLLAQAAAIEPTLQDIALSPDRTSLLGYTANGTATIWSTAGLTTVLQLSPANGFRAAPLVSGSWLDNNTVLLADSDGLIQQVRFDPALVQFDPTMLTITPLAGQPRNERLVLAVSQPGGQLLTAGFNDSNFSSARLWQADRVPLRTAAGLPDPNTDLCAAVQRTLPLPSGIDTLRPDTARWLPGDVLLLTDRLGAVVRWPLPGDPIILDADPNRPQVAVAPNGKLALQYGGDDSVLWRAGSADWVRVRTLPGLLQDAVWTEAGLLAQTADGAVSLLDPETDAALSLSDDVALHGSAALAPDILLAVRAETLDVIALPDGEVLAQWPRPEPGRPAAAVAGPGTGGRILYKQVFGPLHLLTWDPAARQLRELWRTEQRFLSALPGVLHPTLPLAASVDGGVAQVYDLADGRVAWRSTRGAAQAATHGVLAVQWSADGQHLITLGQPVGASRADLVVDVWRWQPDPPRGELLQELPASSLLALSPDGRFVLAGEPRLPDASHLRLYPLFAATTALIQAVKNSCLLDRPLTEAQRANFLEGGP